MSTVLLGAAFIGIMVAVFVFITAPLVTVIFGDVNIDEKVRGYLIEIRGLSSYPMTKAAGEFAIGIYILLFYLLCLSLLVIFGIAILHYIGLAVKIALIGVM